MQHPSPTGGLASAISATHAPTLTTWHVLTLSFASLHCMPTDTWACPQVAGGLQNAAPRHALLKLARLITVDVAKRSKQEERGMTSALDGRGCSNLELASPAHSPIHPQARGVISTRLLASDGPIPPLRKPPRALKSPAPASPPPFCPSSRAPPTCHRTSASTIGSGFQTGVSSNSSSCPAPPSSCCRSPCWALRKLAAKPGKSGPVPRI